MKKHRIVVVKKGSIQFYAVEYRWLFVFWIPYFDMNEHEIMFPTIKSAEMFIERRSKPAIYPSDPEEKRKVVKYL